MSEPADRRAAERFAVNADTSCPFLAPVAEDFGLTRVRDISMQGVGLLVGRRLEPGTSLAAVLAHPARGLGSFQADRPFTRASKLLEMQKTPGGPGFSPTEMKHAPTYHGCEE